MNPVPSSNPVGEQLAEAILAAALTLPVVFAFGVLNSSRWFRGATAPQTAESSPALHSARQSAQISGPTPQAAGLRRTPHTKAGSSLGERRGEIQKNRDSAVVAVSESPADDGAQTATLAAGGAAPTRPVPRGSPSEETPQKGTEF